ncbi:uncharacterized protein [Solanum tuberosum]|uniref:Hydroxyproline-rich glycoprotein family protein n=1 Tax=Solanum tuberosum TaxID=4113 RepID=M1C8F1_SOLTU|nr:PREDICTED: uncharacterized protein LOC102597541 [Solanum tuberosum]
MDQDSAPYISKKQKPNHADYPCKLYNIFSFKTMLLIIFLVALPLFPFQAPEIITQTGNWELVQLILVGIAVSYGLFSRKTDNDNDDDNNDDETENEYLYSSKFDNVQSKLLDVSSFFENHQDENRVNNYQYCSGKPVVVVAKENDAIISSSFVEKPLLLPIRSLKSPVLEPISTTNSPKSMISSPRKIDQFDHKIVRKQSFNKSSVSHPPPPPSLPSPSIVKKSTLLRSSSIVMDDHNGSFGKELRRSTKSVPFELSSYKGKSVRTIRPFIGAARARVYAKDFMNGKAEDERNKKVDTQMQVVQPALMDFSGEEKKTSIFENVVEESDEDSDEYIEESSENVDEERKCVVDGSPDNVDKKADEFIAKFREQIRLQRIQSIRTSAKQPAKKLIQ